MFIVNYTDYADRFNRDKRKEFSTKDELDAFIDRVNKYYFDVVIDSISELKNK